MAWSIPISCATASLTDLAYLKKQQKAWAGLTKLLVPTDLRPPPPDWMPACRQREHTLIVYTI
ncbi:protein of unknown function [Methylocaldum szegediense]|uniref:Uncharacterized protein n=1 Tax=Methylocaldum szegediense TaxID=73780 RepID=A0ABN8X507_9GAMM|nr:protein of unknown function [Methylocaldum szegediense]